MLKIWGMTTVVHKAQVFILQYIWMYLSFKKTFVGAIELKQAKINVKRSTFLQLLLHLSIWCHFSGMWFRKSCAYWIIWVLKYPNSIIKCYNFMFWFEWRTFDNFIEQHYFHKGPFNFHNTILFTLNFFVVICGY
jgi:hypothetical protein